MSENIANQFCWCDLDTLSDTTLSDEQRYKLLADWALAARIKNPGVFDLLSAWVLDDEQWTADRLDANRRMLMDDVLARFKAQNARLAEVLNQLKPSGVVNPAVFPALSRFDEEAGGDTQAPEVRDAVAAMFADFSAMLDRDVRRKIGGGATGPTGTGTVDFFGYINFLSSCESGVQWALFMPDMVKNQQQGFHVESFECRTMPPMRFVGREIDDTVKEDMDWRRELFDVLDGLDAHKSDFGYDLFFMHHGGEGVDVGRWRGLWGRFMRADTPVPQGFCCIDLVPRNNGKPGAPFISQFTFATFAGDTSAMHRVEGFDSDAMYDVTRNIMLGQGIHIPYPNKYWTAEVFLNGYSDHGTAYIFSAELSPEQP